MFTQYEIIHKRLKGLAMVPIYSPNREEIKNFLKKIENRIRRNESKEKNPHKFESRL